MINILLENDLDKKKKICSENNVVCNDNVLCYICSEALENLGYIIFEKFEKVIVMHCLRLVNPNDMSLTDGMIRSVLGYAAMNNISIVKVGDMMNKKLVQLLGFLKDDGDLIVVHEALKCNCKK